MGKSLKLIVESLLFSSEKPLTVSDIRACLPDAQPSEIKEALKVLMYDYNSLNRSFELREVANGYQLRSRPEYGAYILKMLQSSPSRLSRASMETLAIIAYKQPILRHEIERLRGVDVGGILRTLLEKNLIRIMGRKDLPGKPLIYGTTKLFLEVFDLKDIDSLPKLKEIKDFGSEQFEPTRNDADETLQEDIKESIIIPEQAPETAADSTQGKNGIEEHGYHDGGPDESISDDNPDSEGKGTEDQGIDDFEEQERIYESEMVKTGKEESEEPLEPPHHGKTENQ